MLQIISDTGDLKSIAAEIYRLAIEGTPDQVAPLEYKTEILTGQQLSERLAVDVQTLAKWREKGKIPYLRLGAAIRYDFNKVIAALEVTKKKGASK
jgi:hypothetical protein